MKYGDFIGWLVQAMVNVTSAVRVLGVTSPEAKSEVTPKPRERFDVLLARIVSPIATITTWAVDLQYVNRRPVRRGGG